MGNTNPVTLDLSKSVPISAPVTLDMSKSTPIDPWEALGGKPKNAPGNYQIRENGPIFNWQDDVKTLAAGQHLAPVPGATPDDMNQRAVIAANKMSDAQKQSGISAENVENRKQIPKVVGASLIAPALPFVPLAAATAPVAMVTGLAGGYAGGKAGRAIANAAGGGEEAQDWAGLAGGIAGGYGGAKLGDVLGGAATGGYNWLKSKLVTPEAPTGEPEPPAPTPKPVSTPVKVDTPLDDATIRKLGGKDLSAEARATIQQHSGGVIPAASSPETELLTTVRPVNETIQQQGAKLDAILKNAPPLEDSLATKPGGVAYSDSSALDDALFKLKTNLPGGTEESLGKAIDKEFLRYQGATASTDPVEINNAIRDLDQRINSYRAPEQPLDTPADAADAARVTLRRALRSSLDTALPETQPINDVLGKNLEVRSLLRQKFGDVAFDPDAADAQAASEYQKGKTQLDTKASYEQAKSDFDARKTAYDAQAAKVSRNQKIALGAAGVGSGAAGILLRDWLKGPSQ